MASHEEILAAVRRLCRERGEWTFTPNEVVQALPHLNPGTIRTHVTSRCCVNAPRNHPHKWDYFRRVGHGVYEVMPNYRIRAARSSVARETRAAYGRDRVPTRHIVHALIARSGPWYSAECLEIAVVTQGRTVDETIANLRDAVSLHIEGEDVAAMGLAAPLTLAVTFEEPIGRDAASSKA